MEKKRPEIPPLLLSLAGALLLCGGFLFPSFPFLIFVGIAPLMALPEPAEKSSGSILEKMELVLLALTIPLLAYAWVAEIPIVNALAMGILFTLTFVGHAWVRRVLGVRSGKITLILFWLAAEYLVLKVAPLRGIYLADTLSQLGGWMRWTTHTGYLGATLWILVVNWCVYMAVLQGKGILWPWALLGIGLLPLLYAATLTNSPISRELMINLYANKVSDADVIYLARGELVVRTATWLSALILLFTFVRQQIRK